MKKLFFLLLITLPAIKLTPQKAVIYEEMKEMKTYPFSDPDPLPRPGKIYPYYRFDGYSVNPVMQEWTMVCMENDWIKLWIAPEIGGKIYGALDKTNGKYFIYYNNVVKFRDIAMRGPWTSGGIEMNFGSIGHSPTTSSPVDYYVRMNPDSSVSCFVGALDLPGRTEWRVEIYLPADKALFQTRVKWENPSSIGTSLYHWMNASADVTDDLRYYFPGTRHTDHSGNIYPWPVNEEGKDISIYLNNDFGGDHSYHVLGKYTDWFAGYYEDGDYGFGHWSLYPLKTGKKIWMWALSRQGEIWKFLLTDTAENKQYTEIQTGLIYNQAGSGSTYSTFKHLELEPGSELFINERWFPLSKISGVKAVSENVALNITGDKQEQRVSIYAFNRIADTVDIITEAPDTISKQLYLLATDTVNIGLKSDAKISKIYLRNKKIYIYRADDRDKILERPLESRNFDWNSVYGTYYQAIEYMRQRDYQAALEYVNSCINQDQYFMPAYTKLAELEMRRFRYDKAEEAVKHILAFDAYDPEANYIFALLKERKGNLYQAKDAYGIAMLSNKYYNSCINKLALLSLRDNNPDEACKYINYALSKGINNSQIKKTRLVLARKAGSDSLFKFLYDNIIRDEPLNHFARFENYLVNYVDSTAETMLEYINNEFPYQTMLEIACWYINYELYPEALAVLELSSGSALIDLYLAFIYDRLGYGSKSDHYLNKFVRADIDFVFPFRSETENILRWASERSSSWKIGYYLALTYWNSGDNNRARDLFLSLVNEPTDWKFFIARGDFMLAYDDSVSESDYRKAYKLAPGEWRAYHRMIEFYFSGGYNSRALELSTRAYDKFRGNYIIDFDHARCLLAKDSIYRCLDVLKETVILPHEGARQGREVWKKANVFASLDSYLYGSLDDASEYIENAYRWPENLGVGKPYNVDERLLDFVKAMVSTKRKEIEKARTLYEKIITKCTNDSESVDLYNILKVFALRELNRGRESENYYNEFIVQLDNDRIRQWAILLHDGRYEEAGRLALMKPEITDTKPWEESADFPDLSLLHRVVKTYRQEKY